MSSGSVSRRQGGKGLAPAATVTSSPAKDQVEQEKRFAHARSLEAVHKVFFTDAPQDESSLKQVYYQENSPCCPRGQTARENAQGRQAQHYRGCQWVDEMGPVNL